MNRADEKRARLRAGLAGPGAIVAVGAHDALSACLIEQRAFDAVWVSGLGVSTMAHALPDLNLTTMSEALEAAVRIDRATSLPVIADCDNGFGGFGNVHTRRFQQVPRGATGLVAEIGPEIAESVFLTRESPFSRENHDPLPGYVPWPSRARERMSCRVSAR